MAAKEGKSYVIIIDNILLKYDSSTLFEKLSQVASIKWMSLDTENKSVTVRFNDDHDAELLGELGAITIESQQFKLRLDLLD